MKVISTECLEPVVEAAEPTRATTRIAGGYGLPFGSEPHFIVVPDDAASPSLEKGAEAAALRAEHEDTGPHEGCSCATCRAARGPSPTQPYRANIPSMTLREQADCARWSPDDYMLGVVPQRRSCPQCGMGACMHERPVDRLE